LGCKKRKIERKTTSKNRKEKPSHYRRSTTNFTINQLPPRERRKKNKKKENTTQSVLPNILLDSWTVELSLEGGYRKSALTHLSAARFKTGSQITCPGV